MAEAEDVITDAARHATVFIQRFWRRHHPQREPDQLELADVSARLDLLARAVFGRGFRLRPAQPPAPRSWLDMLLRRGQAPPPAAALPATDGDSIWLPRSMDLAGGEADAVERYRCLMLLQAMRAVRGSAPYFPVNQSALVQACYHILEARAAQDALLRLLPGMQGPLLRLRAQALAARPALGSFAAALQPLERLLRMTLGEADVKTAGLATADTPATPTTPTTPATPSQLIDQASRHAAAFGPDAERLRGRLLYLDAWLGELRIAPGLADGAHAARPHSPAAGPLHSARLARRPRARAPLEGEDDRAQGPTIVQTAQPHEQAEDAMGMQRPTDRDTDTAADEFADALAELPEARLVSSPAAAREVLLSDDPPDPQAARAARPASAEEETCSYPEWDWRAAAYRDPGASVRVSTVLAGDQATVDAILGRRAPLLLAIRRHFELLRAQRSRLRRQLEGDDVDLQGWIDSQAQLRAGGCLDQRLYETSRRGRRDLAVTLLVDISGSTDGWVGGQSRVIDVEREALLMVCVALDGLGEAFSVLGFSGEGPHGVVVRAIKRFHEPYDNTIALRIAGLEPEHFTRAGAALRHASADLMAQAVEHKLLILLSDGKPNDMDEYDGRYGVEDMRQAVMEARLQGISPFCLTIDHQAAHYLPAIFGEHAYALIQRAELLPGVLLAWLRKLVAS